MKKFFEAVSKFIEKNYPNPLLWIALLLLLAGIAFWAIRYFTDQDRRPQPR